MKIPIYLAPRRVPLIAATLLATILATASAYAQTTTTTNTTTGGNASIPIGWSTGNWSPAVSDWSTASAYVANNASGASTTMTLDTNVTVGGLEYTGASGYTLLSDGTHTLTLDGTDVTSANPFGAPGVAFITQANGNASAARSFTLGNSSVGLTINMATGLDVGTTSGTGSGFNLYGTIDNTSGSAQTLTLLEDSNAGTGGAPSIAIFSSIGTNSASAINIVNAGTTGGATPAAGRGTVTISGALGAQVASVTQNSATSKLIISGNNTAFVGNTIVNAGVLSIGSAYTFASGTSNQITLDGSTSPVAGTDYGQITVTAGTLTLGGALTLDFSGTLTGGATYSLLTKSGTGAISGDFTAVSIAGSYVLSLTETSGVWSGTADGVTFSLTSSTGVLTTTVSAIPEPATYGALLGALGLAFAACKRRRRAA